MGDKVQALAQALHRLGYHAAVPSDLARQPNFEFVADCFAFLCQRIDPKVTAARNYGSEQKRAAFLSALGSQLYAHTRLKPDLRRLYRSGSSAAGELLALATALLDTSSGSGAEGGGPPNQVARLQQSRGEDCAAVQRLAAAVAVSGQQLLGALARAPGVAGLLDAALTAGADLAGLKTAAREVRARAQARVEALQRAVAELEEEQASLEAKVEKRHVELDRMERRMDALHAIRPVQSAELDRLEGELAELYKAYLHKWRNLEYLEGQLDRYNAIQEAKAEEADKAMRRIQRQMREEEARVLLGDQNGDPNHHHALGGGLGGGAYSEDSEAFEPKALPRLGAALAGAGRGQGALSDHLLLVPDDSNTSACQAVTSGLARAGSARASGAGSIVGVGSRRPSSAAAWRAGGSSTGGGGADVLVVGEEMQRLGLEERGGGGLPMPGDNDF